MGRDVAQEYPKKVSTKLQSGGAEPSTAAHRRPPHPDPPARPNHFGGGERRPGGESGFESGSAGRARGRRGLSDGLKRAHSRNDVGGNQVWRSDPRQAVVSMLLMGKTTDVPHLDGRRRKYTNCYPPTGTNEGSRRYDGNGRSGSCPTFATERKKTMDVIAEVRRLVGIPTTADECVDALLRLWKTTRIRTKGISAAESNWLFTKEAELLDLARHSPRFLQEIHGESSGVGMEHAERDQVLFSHAP
jgi:hypothetical protein